MSLPDLKPLADAGGWVVAVAVVIAVLGLIVLGKLVPGTTHDRALKQNDDLTAKLGEQTTLARETATRVATIGQNMEFLVDFVRDTIRERMRRDA